VVEGDVLGGEMKVPRSEGLLAPYEPGHLAVVVPTKDRPHKVRNLLDSLAAQSAPVGRVVVVDAGVSARKVVEEFVDRLARRPGSGQ